LKNVISAIDSDPTKNHNVFLAEKIHKRLANKDKTKDGTEAAQDFFNKAKALYKYSAYFEGANKDEK